MSARRNGSSERGFTLMEVVVSVALFALVIGLAGVVSKTGAGVFRTTSLRTELEKRAQRVLDRVTEEVSKTGEGRYFPDPDEEVGSPVLNFQQAVGLAGTAADWGPLMRLAFEYEDGELDNGADDNGNGLVDEGVVVMTRDVGGPGEARVVLCHGVSEYLEGEILDGDDDNGNLLRDEEGLSFQRVGEVITIRLTVEGLESGGALVQRTLETSVRLRN